MLIANNATTNPSQPKIAFLRCRALQRAIRAARFFEGCKRVISMLLPILRLQIKGGRDSGLKKRPLPSRKRAGGRGAQRYALVGGCSASLQAAAKVPVIAGHLA